MALTPAQLIVFKAAILAETAPGFVELRQAGATGAMAEFYRQESVPTFYAWRTRITKEEVYANGFNWVAIDDVTEPKWRVWIELFSSGAMNPSKPNVRAGIEEVWKGNAVKLAVQTYVLDKCKRAVNRAEKLFATGTGTFVSPALLGFEGQVTDSDVVQAINLP